MHLFYSNYLNISHALYMYAVLKREGGFNGATKVYRGYTGRDLSTSLQLSNRTISPLTAPLTEP